MSLYQYIIWYLHICRIPYTSAYSIPNLNSPFSKWNLYTLPKLNFWLFEIGTNPDFPYSNLPKSNNFCELAYDLSKLQCKNFKMGKNMKTLKSREGWLDLEYLFDVGILGIKTYYTMTFIFQKKYSQFLKIITKLRMSICGKRRSSLVKSWIF